MFPRLANHRVLNRDLSAPVLLRQLALCDAALSIAEPNHTNVGFCQESLDRLRALSGPGAALCLSIRHVIGVRAKKQMVRADTRGVVASVTHIYAIRDGAAGQFSCDAVCLLV